MRIVITCGPSYEPIDSVRYVGNRSSGRMGLALAEAASQRGAEVTVVLANVTLPAPQGVRAVRVETAAQLSAACDEEFPTCDVLLHKIKKTGPDVLSEIELEPTEDILSKLASLRRAQQVLVGFAAEHGEDALAYGREKLERKGLDAIVINDISRADIGFDSDHNEVLILTRDGVEERIPRMAKGEVAKHVLDQVGRLRIRTHPPSAARAGAVKREPSGPVLN